jgi:thiamine biosynthesis lipoprotein
VVAAAQWRALGTSVHLLTHELDIAPARAAAERVLADVDATCSRFRPDSELQLAQAGPRREVHLSALLTLAIDAAMHAARWTDGAVDPTVGRAIRAIGYDADFSLVANREAAIEIRLQPVPGWRAVRFDARNRTLRMPAGVELDLGSIGKALAADLAAVAALGGSLTGGVLISLGGDIATAGHAPSGGWRILAAEDSNTAPDQAGEVISIDGAAVATSSTRVRRWRAGGIERHHLIDPQTGGPVDGPWRTASVVADTCVEANAAATAAIVLGARARSWVEASGLAARLVDRAGRVIRVGGWPEPTTGASSWAPSQGRVFVTMEAGSSV